MPEKVVFFLDYANISRAASDKRIGLDYGNLLEYVSEGRFLIDAYCYVPIDPRNEHRLDKQIESLWRCGYVVNAKKGSIAGKGYKCNYDIEIAMDILNMVYQTKPDIIVLATGDGDFTPLVLQVRKLGVRVETASFRNAASEEIMLKSSGFIDLDLYYEEYLSNSQQEQIDNKFSDEQEQTIDEEGNLEQYVAEDSEESAQEEKENVL